MRHAGVSTNNHPLVSVSVLQSKQTGCRCAVRVTAAPFGDSIHVRGTFRTGHKPRRETSCVASHAAIGSPWSWL